MTIPATLTIDLSPPITVKGIEYAAVALKEPTISQVRDAHAKLDDPAFPSPAADREYQLTFVATVSGLPRVVVDALPVSRLREAVGFLQAHVSADLPDADDPDAFELVVKLEPPLRINGGEIGEFTLREPTGGQLRKAEDLLGGRPDPLPGPVKKYQMRLIQDVSDLPALAVAQLPISKSKEAVRFLEGFERSARATGQK